MTFQAYDPNGKVDETDKSCIFSTLNETIDTGGECTFVFSTADQSSLILHFQNDYIFGQEKSNEERIDEETGKAASQLPTINFDEEDMDWQCSFADSQDVLEMLVKKAQKNIDDGLSEEVDWSEL
ncbi:MAG: hypothetical protein HOC09_08425 [Deltaproteobacteria bacterium]|jgi:hypothetical protein|nr:hypothetical protein [Deltaproteobacteria bacterium]